MEQQDYPKDKIEWVIIDDGTDLIEDLVIDIPYVKYFKFTEKSHWEKKETSCIKNQRRYYCLCRRR